MINLDSPNGAQTLFALFFAIMWGTLSNVWPRWRPFDISLTRDEGHSIYWRWIISFCFLNLIPILFFIYVMMILSGWQLSGSCWEVGSKLFVIMLQPFSLVGFYWIWISIIQKFRSTFYPAMNMENYRNLSECDLDADLARINFRGGIGYVLIPFALLRIVSLVR